MFQRIEEFGTPTHRVTRAHPPTFINYYGSILVRPLTRTQVAANLDRRDIFEGNGGPCRLAQCECEGIMRKGANHSLEIVE
jgi:hypothetical protein